MGAIEDISHLLVGEDPTRVEYLWQMMYRQHFWHGHGIVRATAIAGIDLALWDKAQWTGTLYKVPHDKNGIPGGEPGIAVPGLALLFKNKSAGLQIFEQWLSEFGQIDTQETIRLLIIRGINRKKRHHYRITISSDPTKGITGDRLKVFSVAARINTMEADTGTNLDGFLQSFEQAKEFHLLPAFVSGTRPPDFSTKHALLKRDLVVRHAWEIGIHDQDCIAIHSSDDPVIPPNQSAPPVRDLLTQLHRDERAATAANRPPPPPQSRNSLCNCGSGRKYKNCHGAT